MYYKECPYCGNLDPKGTNTCSKCGAGYQADVQLVCFNCRNRLPPNNKYCGVCGTSIVPQETQQIQPVIIQQPINQPIPQQPVVNNYFKPPKQKTTFVVERKRRSCLFDIFMICITGGLWIIWMLIRR